MPETALPAITRRRGLLALAIIGPIGLLAACTTEADPGPDVASASAAPGPVDATAAQEADLIEQYESVLAAFPAMDADTAGALAAIRDQHAQHRDALGGGSAGGAAPAVPASQDAALAALIAAERAAARDRIRACVDSPTPETARLLAFIGASEASHVPALRDLRA